MINYEKINLNYILDTAKKFYFEAAEITNDQRATILKHQFIKLMCEELQKTSGKFDFEIIEIKAASILSDLIGEKYPNKA